MRADPDGSALSVICPVCRRPVGRNCVSTANGHAFTGYCHRERLAEAQILPAEVPPDQVAVWKAKVAAHAARKRRERA